MSDTPPIPLTDDDYDRFEEQIPALAERATREAYERALQSGQPVVITIGNSIVEVTLDGSIKEIKKIPAARHCATQRFFQLK